MEQGPQSVEVWEAAVAKLQLATVALAAVMANHEDSYCPPLTYKKDVVYIGDYPYWLAGWQLTPCASPDYSWGAADPTRLAVGVDGQLYAARWNNKHVFTPAHPKAEEIQWITQVVEAHTLDAMMVPNEDGSIDDSQRHLARLILSKFPPEPQEPLPNKVIELTRQADTGHTDHVVDFEVAS